MSLYSVCKFFYLNFSYNITTNKRCKHLDFSLRVSSTPLRLRSLQQAPSLFTASPLAFGQHANKCVTRRTRASSDNGPEPFALNNLSMSLCNDSGINECVGILLVNILRLILEEKFLFLP